VNIGRLQYISILYFTRDSTNGEIISPDITDRDHRARPPTAINERIAGDCASREDREPDIGRKRIGGDPLGPVAADS